MTQSPRPNRMIPASGRIVYLHAQLNRRVVELENRNRRLQEELTRALERSIEPCWHCGHHRHEATEGRDW